MSIEGVCLPVHVDADPHPLFHREPHIGEAAFAGVAEKFRLFFGLEHVAAFAHGAERAERAEIDGRIRTVIPPGPAGWPCTLVAKRRAEAVTARREVSEKE